MKEYRVRVKAWIEVNGEDLLGPGGYEILKAIKEEGSISRASRRLGMSYKFVWRYLKRMERIASVKLLQPWRGGASHGGTKLTKRGEYLLRFYEDLMNELKELEKRYTKMITTLMSRH